MSNYFQVAVDFPGRQSIFTYASESELITGDLVEVPFGRGARVAKGCVIRKSSESEVEQIDKEIETNIRKGV